MIIRSLRIKNCSKVRNELVSSTFGDHELGGCANKIREGLSIMVRDNRRVSNSSTVLVIEVEILIVMSEARRLSRLMPRPVTVRSVRRRVKPLTLVTGAMQTTVLMKRTLSCSALCLQA
jgi:hypothetical protein